MNDQTHNIVVNGVSVPVEGEKNLLEVIRKAGVDLPTLCHHPELTVFGGCRQCVVESENGQILTACSSPATPGLKVKTHTPRVQRIRKMALELTLARHDRECTTCGKSGDCRLQELSTMYGIDRIRFGQTSVARIKDVSAAGITYEPSKCVLCGACVRTCNELQGIGAVDFAYRGANIAVSPAFGRGLGETECVQCGQCAAVCPTGALMVHSEIDRAWEALQDPEKFVVVQVAPAVRVAIGEAFGMSPGETSMGQIVTALRLLGADRVFDTVFAADLTVMEETTEFLGRLKAGERLPLFTSCCPGWVKFAEHRYPELLPHLSSCKSPQQMFGSVIKGYYARQLQRKPEDLFVISVMPCTAKKFEAARPEFETDGVRDVDLVLTTQELVRMIEESGIRFNELPEGELDAPFGNTTGAGLIFGATGGVAEAVLRAAHWFATGESLPAIEFEAVRGDDRVKMTQVDVAGTPVRVAVTHTLAQARELIEQIKAGEVEVDIVEVMACPGGCVGGGGQPFQTLTKSRYQRSTGLYQGDRALPVRRSQENPAVKQLYEQWLGEPNSELAHAALHTTYTNRQDV